MKLPRVCFYGDWKPDPDRGICHSQDHSRKGGTGDPGRWSGGRDAQMLPVLPNLPSQTPHLESGVRGYTHTNVLGKLLLGFPAGSVEKNLPANAGDTGPSLGRNGGGNSNPLQYSCLENPMDRGTWQDIVHGVT